jgi:thiamine biosynthesis protein ThiI
VSIEIWDERAYIFTETVQGMGGLPVGTQGKVLVWLDGTRSSFEAAKLALKRGCEVEVLAVGKKAMQSARRLLAHHSRITVHFIPLDGIENSSKDGTLSYWVRQAVLGEVAKRRNASAVVVPDTAGTLLSLGLTTAKSLDELAGVLVLRPLLGASLIKLEKPPPTRPRVTPTDNWQRKAAKILSKIRTEVLRLKT